MSIDNVTLTLCIRAVQYAQPRFTEQQAQKAGEALFKERLMVFRNGALEPNFYGNTERLTRVLSLAPQLVDTDHVHDPGARAYVYEVKNGYTKPSKPPEFNEEPHIQIPELSPYASDEEKCRRAAAVERALNARMSNHTDYSGRSKADVMAIPNSRSTQGGGNDAA